MTAEHDISDRLLRAFVTAAKAGTFSGAARELGVGQPAVSHAIARLEQALRVTLFERSPSGISLTSRGAALHEALAPRYSEIDRAIGTFLSAGGTPVVTLSVSTSLATYWLIPRLPDFKRRHPDIELRVITTDTDRSVGTDDADLWIPLGSVERRGLDATFFCPEELIPVCSPELAESLAPGEPSSLLDAPLLHLEERYSPRFDWHRWFAENDVATTGELAGYRSNDYSLILQAALDGQGVALGWSHIVDSLLHRGQLVALAPPVRTDHPFPVLVRRDRPLSEPASELRDWLVASAAPLTDRR